MDRDEWSCRRRPSSLLVLIEVVDVSSCCMSTCLCHDGKPGICRSKNASGCPTWMAGPRNGVKFGPDRAPIRAFVFSIGRRRPSAWLKYSRWIASSSTIGQARRGGAQELARRGTLGILAEGHRRRCSTSNRH